MVIRKPKLSYKKILQLSHETKQIEDIKLRNNRRTNICKNCIVHLKDVGSQSQILTI